MADYSSRLVSDGNSSDNATKGAKLDATDLCYSIVNQAGKMKRLLKNVSFGLESGDLCALMGPSGAGKSTLLDLLAARKLEGTWSGEVYVDGAPRVKSFGRETAYVLQDDYHIATLTVEETIRYAARVKLPDGTSKPEVEKRVKLLLDMMGLGHVKDCRIGDGMTKGISGGQVKRLSIAVEIVHLPRLIFLDEPTSGLDSSIAFEVMSTVRNITTIERTCVCTIHQPSREIFALFDKLVVISGGRLIFFGAATDAVVYFTQPELGFKFAGGYKNPAEFIIDVSCGQQLAEGFRVPRQPEELEVLYKSSRFYRPTPLTGRADVTRSQQEDVDPWGMDHSSRYATSLWTQTVVLCERSWVAKIRDTADRNAQLIKSLSLGFIAGILYYNAGDISEPFYEDGVIKPEAYSINSFLYIFSLHAMLANLASVPYICSRTHLYKRELASSTFAPFPFFISSLAVMMPLVFVYHLIMAGIAYGMVGLNSNAGVFFYFVFITYLGSMVSVTTAMALASNAPNEAAALGLYPVQFLIFATFSGFPIHIEDVPPFWSWMPPLSYLRWIFEGLMVNQWKQYDTDDAPGDDATGAGDVLDDYSFDSFNAADTIWISMLFGLGFSAIMYWGLLPPASKLIRVANASDVVTVMSVNDSTASSVSSAFSRDQKAVRSAKTKKGYTSNLKENLLEGAGNLEERMVVEDPLLEHVPPVTVESFRISSGVVERAQGCRLIFRDVHYTVTNKADGATELTLLKGVTGRALPGEMVALMGASGAGKSTLLDVLAQRKTTGNIQGEISYNGSPEMKSSAYVMQDNVHMGILTVRESIYYAAELRLNPLMSKEAKSRRVDKIIDMLGLQAAANTILGTQTMRGASGGQVKRVSIGVEIVNLPNLMFLDEPTTGLDSAISLEVMSAVRNLANQNRTVICTIHQPSEDTFVLFDTLLLLAEGRVIYFGAASAAVDYFTKSPYGYVCRPGANPADFVIAVAGSFLPAADGRSVTGGELATYYASTDLARLATENFPEEPDSAAPAVPSNPLLRSADETKEPEQVGPYRTDFWFQLQVLMHRRWTVMKKDPMPSVGPFIRDLLVGMFYGSVYFQLDTGDGCDASCYNDRSSILFFCVVHMMMSQLDNVPVIIDGRAVYYRERGAKAYSPFAYYLSTFLFQFPLMALNVLFFSVGTYPMVGLRAGADYYGYFFVLLFLACCCIMFMTFTGAALAKTTEVALGYFPALFAFNVLYGGYLVYIPTMDDWQKVWIPYLSYFRYAFQGLVLNEYEDNSDLPERNSYIHEMGFDVISKDACCGYLILFACFFATMYYLAIRYCDFEER